MCPADLPRIDQPEDGYYQTRLVKGGPMVPVRLWHGPPPDPHQPGLFLDRSPRWQVWIDGKQSDIDVYHIWTWVAGRRITQNEYEYMVARGKHARRFGTGEPYAEPRQPVDWLRSPPPQPPKPKKS